MPSDQPTEKQKAFDDGRRGRETWAHYYRLGDQSLIDAYNRGAKLFEKFGDPALTETPLGFY